MILVSKTLNTDGTGYWSNVKESVPVTGLELAYENDESDFGELRVYFDTTVWDVDTKGLIYTDRQFLIELVSLLSGVGLETDVSYSEQGMQGDNYVSCDVGPDFIKSYKAMKA